MEPTVITGILMMIGQFSGFMLSLVASPLVVIHPTYALAFFSLCCCVSGISAIIIDEDLKRLKFSQAKIAKNVIRLDALDECSMASSKR